MSDVSDQPKDANDWRRFYLTTLTRWHLIQPDSEAASIAWGEMECRWHALYGVQMPRWCCAGCGQVVGVAMLDLIDGNRVHIDDSHGLDCLIAYGERWRGAATKALGAMGLKPPSQSGSLPAGRQWV